MLDKNLLKYIKGKRHYLVFIILINIVGLFFSLGTTASLIVSIEIFIKSDWENGLFALLVSLGFAILKAMTVYISNNFANKLANYVTKKLRHETYVKYLSLNKSAPFTSQEMAQLSTEGIEQLRLYYSKYIPSFFYAVIAPLLLFVLFMFLDIPVALTYLACVPLIPISIISVSKFAKKIFAKYWDKYLSLGNGFLDATKGMKELKIFQYDKYKQLEMEEDSEEFRKVTMKVLTMQLASVTIMDLVAFGGAGIGIVLTLHSLLNVGSINLYQAIFMILVGAEFFLPLRNLGSAFHVAMNGATAGRKIMTLLNIESPTKGDKELDKLDSIQMNNVSFKYEDASKESIDNITLNLSKGLYSLVGVSGSGKSTLAKLFAKIITPNQGSITINNVDIKDFNDNSFYSKIAYVSNSTYIFHQSIKDSFKLYNPDINENEMREILEKVQLEHLSLDYVIEEGFTNLSGGEKQRLSLAFYLAKKYEFYIFDEITSNIDIESEEIILNIIKELSKNSIVLMISHRLKSTQYSDYIYYLDNGKIDTSGKYDDLLKTDNKFKELFDTQRKLEEVI